MIRMIGTVIGWRDLEASPTIEGVMPCASMIAVMPLGVPISGMCKRSGKKHATEKQNRQRLGKFHGQPRKTEPDFEYSQNIDLNSSLTDTSWRVFHQRV